MKLILLLACFIVFANNIDAQDPIRIPDGIVLPHYEPTPGLRPRLEGWVDMHAHPMAHLAFGGKVIHGAPDTSTIISVIPGDCNRKYETTRNIGEALGPCDKSHGGNDFGQWMLGNNCGDNKRKKLLRAAEKELESTTAHSEEGARGYPDFVGWPAYNNLTHQQMYIDWVRRSYDNGLRVMVALSVNNATYAQGFSGDGDENEDDVSSSDIQISEMKRMVVRHDWMEIALSGSDLRRIVSENKLAIVLGIEVDNIGNFHQYESIDPDIPTDYAKRRIISELRRLYLQGIRYVFPIHAVDNKFGGAAVYEPLFNISNYHLAGKYWDIQCADASDNINYQYESISELEFLARLLLGGDPFRQPANPPSCNGHVNNLGLTTLGRFAIKEMMKLGMMIDVDHMSQRSLEGALALADTMEYPVNSGHNNIRGGNDRSERNYTTDQLRRIHSSGGMIGIGTGDSNAQDFVDQSRAIIRVLGNTPFGIGSDANGMEQLPSPRSGSNITSLYDNLNFPISSTGDTSWNYDEVGVAHYGMFPDFFNDIRSLDSNVSDFHIRYGADRFASMWELCDRAAPRIREGQEINNLSTVQPMNIGELCPYNKTRGDYEYNGNGPRVTINSDLQISSDRRSIVARINFEAAETVSDFSTVNGNWERTVFRAPSGRRIRRIVTPTSSRIIQILYGGGRNEIIEGCDGAEHTLNTELGEAIEKVIMIGDTGGNDISSDNNCHCDTRIKRVVFRPMTVEYF